MPFTSCRSCRGFLAARLTGSKRRIAQYQPQFRRTSWNSGNSRHRLAQKETRCGGRAAGPARIVPYRAPKTLTLPSDGRPCPSLGIESFTSKVFLNKTLKNTYVRISCGLSRSRKAELHCPSTFGMEGEHLLVEQQMSDLDADWGRDESAPNCSVYEHYVVSTCAVMFDCAQKCSDSS
jgi:hypothetical protein